MTPIDTVDVGWDQDYAVRVMTSKVRADRVAGYNRRLFITGARAS